MTVLKLTHVCGNTSVKKNIHVCDFVLGSFVFREYYHLCEFTVTRDKTGVTAFCHRTKTKKDLINEWPAFVCFTQRNAYTEQTTEYVPRRSTGPLMWLSIASCVEPEREREGIKQRSGLSWEYLWRCRQDANARRNTNADSLLLPAICCLDLQTTVCCLYSINCCMFEGLIGLVSVSLLDDSVSDVAAPRHTLCLSKLDSSSAVYTIQYVILTVYFAHYVWLAVYSFHCVCLTWINTNFNVKSVDVCLRSVNCVRLTVYKVSYVWLSLNTVRSL